jgi:RNA polymerase sigma factor (sigma-70 family)
MLHEDRKLLAAYRAGETWAFELLYRSLSEPVRRFLLGGFTFVSRGRTCRYRGGVPGVDTDAIVQETFARAFSPSTRAHYDGERPFKNYLFSIAKNLVLRELARRERVMPLELGDEGTEMLRRKRADSVPTLSSNERDPETFLADGELKAVTKRFVAALDAEGRAFFLFRFVRGNTQEATAEAMKITRARVKIIEKAQRRAFLALLREHGYFVDYAPKPRWSRRAA